MKMKHWTRARKILTVFGVGILGFCRLTLPANATLIYNESTDGDLSGDRFNPTVLPALSQGDNRLWFSITNPDPLLPNKSNRDLDYFTITVPTGFLLTQLRIEEYTATLLGGGIATDQIGFIGLQAGTQFTQPPQPSNPDGSRAITNVSELLGYTLIGTRSAADFFVGTTSEGVVNAPVSDILPAMGAIVRPRQPNGSASPIPNHGLGFTAPLTAGNYVFWAQQTALGIATIHLDFVVSPIPEPTSALSLLILGGLGMVIYRKR